eukprot:3352101-Prymnesium_polylepis.1
MSRASGAGGAHLRSVRPRTRSGRKKNGGEFPNFRIFYDLAPQVRRSSMLLRRVLSKMLR